MHLFYAPILNARAYPFPSGVCIVPGSEASGIRHRFPGRRKRNLCTGEILDPDPRGCRIKTTWQKITGPGRIICIAVALPKTWNVLNGSWKKATEVGIDVITPLICERSERKHCKTERSERVAIAAMKQCKRAQMPVINRAVSFSKFWNPGFWWHIGGYCLCLDRSKTHLRKGMDTEEREQDPFW